MRAYMYTSMRSLELTRSIGRDRERERVEDVLKERDVQLLSAHRFVRAHTDAHTHTQKQT